MSRKNAIKPLSTKLNDYQRGRRATRILARRTVAEQLAAFVIINTEPMRRGFFGRLWWVLRGLPRPSMPRQQPSRRPRGARVVG